MLRIQSTSEINSTILLSAGMDCRTVETMICRFFRNLGADVIANVLAQSLPWKLHLAFMWQHAEKLNAKVAFGVAHANFSNLASHLIVRSTLRAVSALMALNTRSTRKTLASKTPMFCTIRGIRKSTKLASTIRKSEEKREI